MRNMKRGLIAVLAAAILVATLGCFAGCADRAENYTEAEHLERVAALAEKRYMGEGSEYTSFEVHPLYDDSETLRYFLIEFAPAGYVYVLLKSETSLFGGGDMYQRGSPESALWYPYTVEKGAECVVPDESGRMVEYRDRRLKTDADGQYISYRVSHFKAANINGERRYFLPVYFGEESRTPSFIPAVRRGELFLNLVSMEELQYRPEMVTGQDAVSDISFFAKANDL